MTTLLFSHPGALRSTLRDLVASLDRELGVAAEWILRVGHPAGALWSTGPIWLQRWRWFQRGNLANARSTNARLQLHRFNVVRARKA